MLMDYPITTSLRGLSGQDFYLKIFGTPPSRARDGDGDIQNADVYLDHKFLHFLSQRILKEAFDKNMHGTI